MVKNPGCCQMNRKIQNVEKLLGKKSERPKIVGTKIQSVEKLIEKIQNVKKLIGKNSRF